MERSAETFDVLWRRREIALSWLILLCAALLFTLAALMPLGLQVQGPAQVVNDGQAVQWSRELWSFSSGAPSSFSALAAILWALATMWIVRSARAEGEPPPVSSPLLLLAVGGLLLADAQVGWDLFQLASVSADTWSWLGVWAALSAMIFPWRGLADALNADPGHRIERLWQLHGIAGRLLLIGTGGPLLALIALSRSPEVSIQGSDPMVVTLTLAMFSLIGLAIIGLAGWTQSVGAGLDEARLVVPDLPPQPARHRFPRWAVLLGGLSFAASALGVAPWPEARAVQEHLAEVGLAPPTDGRNRWLSLEEVQRRRLVTGKGLVHARFSTSGDQVAATLHGANPGFWILDRRMSWLPNQQRDLWEITAFDISPQGDRMLVGRRSGLLQLRGFPRTVGDPRWSEHRWSPVFSVADRVQLLDDAALVLGEAGHIRRWNSDTGQWQEHLRLGHPLQSFVLSADGERLAGFWGSEYVGIWDRMGNLLGEVTVHGVRKLLWSPDGETLLAAGQSITRISADAPIVHEVLYDRPVTDIALSADGEMLAIVDVGVKVIDPRSGAVLLYEQRPAAGGVTSVAWHPENEGLSVGTSAGVLELWWLSERRWEE